VTTAFSGPPTVTARPTADADPRAEAGPVPTQAGQGHGRKEAMRALKRRISDGVYRQLVLDSRR
jgi:hypothetical protein